VGVDVHITNNRIHHQTVYIVMESLSIEIKVVKEGQMKSVFKKVFVGKPHVEQILGGIKSGLISQGYKRDEVYKKHH
jgi:hypothetical protein